MSTQFDPDGWQYATTLDSPFWHPQNNNALCKSSIQAIIFSFGTISLTLIDLLHSLCIYLRLAVVLRRRTWHRKLQRLPRGSKAAAAAASPSSS